MKRNFIAFVLSAAVVSVLSACSVTPEPEVNHSKMVLTIDSQEYFDGWSDAEYANLSNKVVEINTLLGKINVDENDVESCIYGEGYELVIKELTSYLENYDGCDFDAQLQVVREGEAISSTLKFYIKDSIVSTANTEKADLIGGQEVAPEVHRKKYLTKITGVWANGGSDRAKKYLKEYGILSYNILDIDMTTGTGSPSYVYLGGVFEDKPKKPLTGIIARGYSKAKDIQKEIFFEGATYQIVTQCDHPNDYLDLNKNVTLLANSPYICLYTTTDTITVKNGWGSQYKQKKPITALKCIAKQAIVQLDWPGDYAVGLKEDYYYKYYDLNDGTGWLFHPITPTIYLGFDVEE
ncbi:MAG: hypothetical protein HUJ90_04705 [Bacteroidales bacterium]|nr:hypothetical protein [Bacteroidales bacterium]